MFLQQRYYGSLTRIIFTSEQFSCSSQFNSELSYFIQILCLLHLGVMINCFAMIYETVQIEGSMTKITTILLALIFIFIIKIICFIFIVFIMRSKTLVFIFRINLFIIMIIPCKLYLSHCTVNIIIKIDFLFDLMCLVLFNSD